ncbi:MAG TPA: histidine--tRNA ligase [Fibrobacteria bacterium]|jgi:histidyl-tRNA synthetase|nr:histidine--tRNA ligase [Fibrobacteria bacterium]
MSSEQNRQANRHASSPGQGSVQTPKGTRDFFPADMRLQNHLFDGWRTVCRAFGYEEYEGPTFEHLELYVGKSGPEIVEQLYHFRDKGDRALALRPELTPTLARMVNAKGASLRKPLKWFSIPRLFRYERAQRGRLREFFQLNMDIVGCETVAAEADLIAAVIEMLKGFGLTSADFAVRVSSRALLSEFLDRHGVAAGDKAGVYTALDKRAKIGEEAFRTLLAEQGAAGVAGELERYFQCRSLEDLLQVFPSPTPGEDAALGDMQSLFQLLEAQGLADFVVVDTSVVRGLAYYTGIVFEVFDKGVGLRALAGGGRYDNLMASLGGAPVPAVGFGMGDVVLAELLKERGLLPQGRPGVDYYLADLAAAPGGLPRVGLLRLAHALRERGRTVAYALKGGKFKKQMEEANEAGAKRVLFYGSDRAPEGSYEVKDLATGEQVVAREEEL